MGEKLFNDGLKTWCLLTWMLWSNRNDRVHGRNSGNTHCILDDVEVLLMDYKRLNKMKKDVRISRVGKTGWMPPAHNQLKLKVNAAVRRMRRGLYCRVISLPCRIIIFVSEVESDSVFAIAAIHSFEGQIIEDILVSLQMLGNDVCN
ncbi:hypothetical protein PanWU01x14_270660 [Parasponia andersonii]|uniref:Uncharacterized protein n=1 Tax=Parasponia andersonii TaxID=3476 RepID=A0A2P5B4Y6_PARAD|nr:hypothetical protein PanWU01x14_270660 [Parasponia andersonii]